MKRQATVALVFMTALGSTGLAAAQAAKNDYGDGKNWLCRPERQDLSRRSATGAEADACAVDQSTTIVAADGKLTQEESVDVQIATNDDMSVTATIIRSPGS